MHRRLRNPVRSVSTSGGKRVLGVPLASLGEGDRYVAHLGDSLGVDDRLRHLGKEALHLGSRLEVELLAFEPHPLLVLYLRAGLDAEHRVVGARVRRVHVVDVVRADHLEPKLPRQPQQPRDDLVLLGDPVVLDLDEVVLAAEDVDKPRASPCGPPPSGRGAGAGAPVPPGTR